MTTSTPRKFMFETEFDKKGQIIRAHNYRSTFTKDEVEAEKAAAYQEGAQDTVAQAEAELLKALSRTAKALENSLAQEAQRLRENVCTMALIIGKQLSANALEKFPEHVVEKLISTTVQELRTAPHVVVTVPSADEDKIRPRVEMLASQHGFEGNVLVKGLPNMRTAQCTIDWGQGSAHFDPHDIESQVIALVKSHLQYQAENGPDTEQEPPQ